MLEHYRQPLLTKEKFVRRMIRSIAISLYLLITTIAFGIIIFHFSEKLSWLDAYLNSVMIMTGVGTVGSITTAFGKIFTGIYSIISTFVFFAILAIIATPLLHRLLHKFHLDIKD